MNDLHVSIATRLHEHAPLSNTVHHLSGPNTDALPQGAVVCVVCNVSVSALCEYVQCVGVVCVGVLLVFCWCVWLCVGVRCCV